MLVQDKILMVIEKRKLMLGLYIGLYSMLLQNIHVFFITL